MRCSPDSASLRAARRSTSASGRTWSSMGRRVAGGMPIGLVCGKKDLMRRFDPAHPMRLAYVVGTFSAHPLVMGAMNEFLKWVVTTEAASSTTPPVPVVKSGRRLPTKGSSSRTCRSGWSISQLYGRSFSNGPSRYNWLLQYYLRAEGMTLSWVGTGRCLTSLDFSADDYQELGTKLVNAAEKMKRDAWWLSEATAAGDGKSDAELFLFEKWPEALSRFHSR